MCTTVDKLLDNSSVSLINDFTKTVKQLASHSIVGAGA
jgi:hypothetical protein